MWNTLNEHISHLLIWCFYCWLWTGKCLLGNEWIKMINTIQFDFSLTKWSSVRLRTKWFWGWVQLQSLKNDNDDNNDSESSYDNRCNGSVQFVENLYPKKIHFQKQPSKCLLINNMQQIYRRTPILKCDFNFIEITLWYWCFPVNLSHIFRTNFP